MESYPTPRPTFSRSDSWMAHHWRDRGRRFQITPRQPREMPSINLIFFCFLFSLCLCQTLSLCVSLSLSLSLSLSVWLSLSVCLSLNKSGIGLYFVLSLSLPLSPPVSVSVFACPSVCLSLHPSLSLSPAREGER